ncbi:hypothetical protein [Geodermatophilus maliterrae]|uniref:Uncharacterized protein n=1 Tax=Geodermatophilus maliterrae TaxID=3162531 RepID=A0ABV3XHG9_9ACTN
MQRVQANLRAITGTDRVQEAIRAITGASQLQENLRSISGTDQVQEAIRAITGASQLQENLRSISGTDRVHEAIQAITKSTLAANVSRMAQPPLFEQITGPNMQLLQAVLGEAHTSPLAAQMRHLSGAIEELAAAVRPDAPLVVEQLKVLDRITPSVLHPVQLAATASLARAALPNTGVETWRLSLLAQADVSHLIDVRPAQIDAALLDVLGIRTRAAAGFAEQLAVSTPDRALAAATAHSTRAWRRYLTLTPTPHRVEMSAAASATVGGLIGGEVLIQATGDDSEQVATDVEKQLIGPWHDGAMAARLELFEALRLIDTAIVAFIEGGWDDVVRDGAAAASKIAHCVVEAVDHTLRALAPPEDALAWLHREGRRPTTAELHDGKPTRSARIAFALRNRSGDRRLVQSQAEALSALVARVLEQAQGIKHAPGEATVAQARMLLVTVESLLMQLVLP